MIYVIKDTKIDGKMVSLEQFEQDYANRIRVLNSWYNDHETTWNSWLDD